MDQVLETAPILLFVIDLAGTVTFLEAQHRVIGIDPQLALGKPAFECFKDAPEVLERLHAALAGESFSGLIRIAGNGPFADLTCHPLRGPEGAVIGVSGVLLDATERVRSDEVRRGVEARSLLIATMNHEARTPLNAILGFAELLGSGRHGELNEGQRHYLANIDSAGRQLLSLVSDAIDLTQLERGTLVLSPANPDPDLTVHADRARLLQVLWSLASNGIRFTPHGGMVSLTALPSVPFTHIDVTDTGPGIPAHRLSRIYLEFIGEGSPDEGAGLGLSLTRQLVVLMGGRITVSSRLGAGTTFTLRLPASG
jgi:signal transduction histidine kinase